MFGEYFGRKNDMILTQKNMAKHSDVQTIGMSQVLDPSHVEHPEHHLNPIIYSVDYLFCMSHPETSSEFIRYLANTSNM